MARARARLGQTVGDEWILHGVLGSGGTATVYAAAHVETNAKVALKLLHEWLTEGTSRAVDRIVREARAAAAIGHPSICNVVSWGEHERCPYIAFEWLEGTTLQDALGNGTISSTKLWTVFEELLDALDAAHRAGVVHRDLKPANVFVLDDGPVSAKLLDFGAARQQNQMLETITTEGAVIGTIPYMSPEQARGERVDAASDIFSFGSMVYRALMGRPPYIGSTPFETLHLVATSKPPPTTQFGGRVPEPIIHIVQRALASKPEERWSSASAMRDEMLKITAANVAVLQLPRRRRVEPALLTSASENKTERAPVPHAADFEGAGPTVVAVQDDSVSFRDTANTPPSADDEPVPRRRAFGKLAMVTWGVALFVGGVVLLASGRRDSVTVAEPTDPAVPVEIVREVAVPPSAPAPTATSTPTIVKPEPKRAKKDHRKKRRRKRRRPSDTKIDDVLLEEI